MPTDEEPNDWADLAAEELQLLLAELGVRITADEAENLRLLLCEASDAESALELLSHLSKAA